MAVFTKLTEKQITDFVSLYDLGKLNNYEEVIDGIENTNYKIICGNIPYILTIFEKRVNTSELPFFINLKNYLYKNNFNCPKPIKSKNDEIINTLNDKKAIIISFIDGYKITNPSVDHCTEMGKMVGKLHKLTADFKESRSNSLGLNEWKKILKKCKINNSSEFKNIFSNLSLELKFLEKYLPKNLPSGIIHADLFKDNVFFKNNKISGIIDFYFSCNNCFIYDLAIVINDWCFDNEISNLNNIFFKALIDGYESERKISNSEYESLNIVLRAAAVRILVTRLHDYIFHPNDAILVRKDPNQYFKILNWHQNNQLFYD